LDGAEKGLPHYYFTPERLEEKLPEKVEAEIKRPVEASPLAKRLAKEHNIDLSQVTGTGLSGTITREDILSHIEKTKVRTIAKAEEEEVIPMIGWRKSKCKTASWIF
jgi:pyruvate/2-oxoglutarate dehydrogenase complex dihydrolipoamide acyltransferase (E2) component